MCGRFALKIAPKQLAEMFGLDEVPDLTPRYNIAPGQEVAAVVAPEKPDRRRLDRFLWGLVPGWAKEPTEGLINARSETAPDKPAFRNAFHRRRCLIPADGFYEWHALQGRKQPWYFCRRDGQCLALAGLWELWQGPPDTLLKSCAILTTAANELVANIHDRMPVIIPSEAFNQWLNPDLEDQSEIIKLCRPFPADQMQSWPVGLVINSPRNDTPACLDPITLSPQPPAKGLFDR